MKQLIFSLAFSLMATQAFPQQEKKSLDSLFSAVYTEDNPGAAVALLRNMRWLYSPTGQALTWRNWFIRLTGSSGLMIKLFPNWNH